MILGLFDSKALLSTPVCSAAYFLVLIEEFHNGLNVSVAPQEGYQVTQSFVRTRGVRPASKFQSSCRNSYRSFDLGQKNIILRQPTQV